MRITQTPFGHHGNEPISLFRLQNSNGLNVNITNYGGIVISLNAPDRNGKLADIVLGKDSLEDYLAGHPCFGTITGRVAGRIGGGRFTIDGIDYKLVQNNGSNCLHGGEEGFDKMVWRASIIQEDSIEKLRLTLSDPDGHNNFPGTLDCTVTYALLEDNSFEIKYSATTDKTTPLNLTNHSYFNLAGHDSGDILDHELQIIADTVASVDSDATLVGRKDPVEIGYNDYREAVALKDREVLETGNADIHFNHPEGRTNHPKWIASVYEPVSGRYMEVLTTEPGVQFYAGLALSADGREHGKGGCDYPALSGLCLETQDYADSVNYPDMGGAVLKSGSTFQSTTIFRFSTK
ncbi:MAG: aldose epimerase family protein [Verrucomicrobiota bacterium]